MHNAPGFTGGLHKQPASASAWQNPLLCIIIRKIEASNGLLHETAAKHPCSFLPAFVVLWKHACCFQKDLGKIPHIRESNLFADLIDFQITF